MELKSQPLLIHFIITKKNIIIVSNWFHFPYHWILQNHNMNREKKVPSLQVDLFIDFGWFIKSYIQNALNYTVKLLLSIAKQIISIKTRLSEIIEIKPIIWLLKDNLKRRFLILEFIFFFLFYIKNINKMINKIINKQSEIPP